MNRDPFEVLDIREGASADEVHAAYIRLAKVVHPDRFALDPLPLQQEAARRMTELNQAFQQAMSTLETARRARDVAPTICERCIAPEGAMSFRCATCGSWWDLVPCADCGREGYSVGGPGALYRCRACWLKTSTVVRPSCSTAVAPGDGVGAPCSGCGSAWGERACQYCGAPTLSEGASAAFECLFCRYHNPAARGAVESL